MAITICGECGKEISDMVKCCPHCGVNLKKLQRMQEKQKKIVEKQNQIKQKQNMQAQEIQKGMPQDAEEKKGAPKKVMRYILVVVVIVLGLGSIPLFRWYQNKCMPAVVNLSVKEAQIMLEERQLPFHISYEYTEEYDKDIIYSQSAKAGTFYQSEEEIEICASRGRKYIVPDILDKNINDVITELGKIRYQTNYEYTDDKAEGTIVDISIKLGEFIKEDEELLITISEGIYTVLPDLKGKTEEEAKKIITDFGAKVMEETGFSNNREKGYVFAYSPQKLKDPSTETVTISVSKGKGVRVFSYKNEEIEYVKSEYDGNVTVVYSYDEADFACPSNKEMFIAAQDKEGLVTEEEAQNITLTVGKPSIKITSMDFDINVVGGVDTYATIQNVGEKQIAYVTLEVQYYDRMGYPASCEIRGTDKMSLQYTGPLNSDKSTRCYWETAVYNNSVAVVQPISALIEFTDGTTQSLTYDGCYWKSADFYDGYLKH